MDKEDFKKIINEQIEELNDFIKYCIDKPDNKIKEFDYIGCLVSRRIGLEDLLSKLDKIDITKNTKEEEK